MPFIDSQNLGLIARPSGPLRGEAELPGDKSLSHRAALLAALAEGPSRIENFLVSGVTAAMLQALQTLGVDWRLDGTTLVVQGVGLGAGRGCPVHSGTTLHCGNSATTLRLLAGALAAWGAEATLDGSPGLRRRPMGRIVEPLRALGVEIQAANGCAPLALAPRAGRLQGGEITLPVASAQVKSCLLLAGLSADSPLTLREPGPSRDHTERMLRAGGVAVESIAPLEGGPSAWITRLPPPASRRLTPLAMRLPGDLSAAAFLVVAALLVPGSEITLRGVGLNPTRTGLLDALIEMGGDIQVQPTGDAGGEPVGDLTVRASRLHGVAVGGERVVRMIDEFPIFAVAAAFAEGETVVGEAAELRHKESDRISALGEELRAIGVAFTETPDGFRLPGRSQTADRRPPAPLADLPLSVVFPHGDHRLAMALAVAGLAGAGPLAVLEAAIMEESFPGFVPTLLGFGADLEWREGG